MGLGWKGHQAGDLPVQVDWFFSSNTGDQMEFQLEPDNRNRSNREWIDDLRKIAARLGVPTLTRKQYDSGDRRFSAAGYCRRFGTWREALQQAGLFTDRSNDTVSREECIEDLRRVATEHDVSTITTTQYRLWGKYGTRSYLRHFRTWNAALEVVGLRHSRHYRVADADLFENLANVWIQLGRQPRHSEMRKPFSRFGAGTYEVRFGGWRKALESFIEYVGQADTSVADHERVIQKPTPPVDTPEAYRHRTKRHVGDRLRFRVLQRDHFRCKCGRSPATEAGVRLEADHILAYSKGGETVMDNLQTLCERCNGGKGDLPV